MDLNEIAVNADAIENGAWVEKIPEMGDLRLKVRGIGNSDYRRLQDRLLAAIPRAKRADPAELERVTAECMLKTVLLDWDGLKVNGAATPYSDDLARELLTNAKWQRFRNAVAWAAMNVADEEAIALEDDAKN
jgi:hypothetical protein